jgi:hypothetical protein
MPGYPPHDGDDHDDDEPEPKRRKKNLYASWKSEGDEGEDQNSLKSTENKRAKERERRRHISVSIDDLRRVIPLRFQKERLNQVATMAMAVDYIRYLQQHIVDLEAALAQRRGYDPAAFSAPPIGGPGENSPPKMAPGADLKMQQAFPRQMMGAPVGYPPMMHPYAQHPMSPMMQRDFPNPAGFGMPPNYQMPGVLPPGQVGSPGGQMPPGQFPEESMVDMQHRRVDRPPGYEVKQEPLMQGGMSQSGEFRADQMEQQQQPLPTQSQTHNVGAGAVPLGANPFSHLG